MFDPELFEYVRCPITKSDLREAPAELIAQLNAMIKAGELRSRIDLKIDEPLESGLINADQTFLFPSRQGIPTIIPDEAIPLKSDQA